MSFIKYIADESHYKEVLMLVSQAMRTVWIGTADIKDLYVDDKPFLALLASLLKKGVEVRLIHAKEPGTAWREDHERHPILYDGMERVLCPRVHFKLIIIDGSIAYVGSANLTGAGMGMKSPRKRNFEAGEPRERLCRPSGHRQGLLRQASHVKYSSKRSDYLRFNIIFAMPLTILLVLFCSTKISENSGMA